MMTRAQFDAHCSALPGTTNVVQWGDASVWKVGGKIFAICSNWGPASADAIAFKCSDLAYQMLCERDGCIRIHRDTVISLHITVTCTSTKLSV